MTIGTRTSRNLPCSPTRMSKLQSQSACNQNWSLSTMWKNSRVSPARRIFGNWRSPGFTETVAIPSVSLATIYKLYSGSMVFGRLKTIVGVDALHGSKDHSVDSSFIIIALRQHRSPIGFSTFSGNRTLQQMHWPMRDRWETMALKPMLKTTKPDTGNILRGFGMVHWKQVMLQVAVGRGLVGAISWMVVDHNGKNSCHGTSEWRFG